MLSSFDIANALAVAAQGVILFYTAYFAIGVRRTFSVGVYRHQALGVGLVATIFGLVLVNNYVYSYLYDVPTGVIQNNLGPLGLPGLLTGILLAYNWIDASALAGRRADPYFRDTLNWSSVRLIIWPLALGAYAVALGGYAYLGGFSGAPPSGNLPAWLFVPFVVIFFVIPLTAIIVLPVTAIRAKDPTLRRQVFWFALFFAPPLLGGFAIGLFSDINQQLFAYYAVDFAADFCLYLSARALVPLYRFSAERGTSETPVTLPT